MSFIVTYSAIHKLLFAFQKKILHNTKQMSVNKESGLRETADVHHEPSPWQKTLIFYGALQGLHSFGPTQNRGELPQLPIIGRQSRAVWDISWKMGHGEKISLAEFGEQGIVGHQIHATGKETMPLDSPLIVFANHPYDGDLQGYEQMTALFHYIETARQGGGDRLDPERNRTTTMPHAMIAVNSENGLMAKIGFDRYFHQHMIDSFENVGVKRANDGTVVPLKMMRILQNNGVILIHPEANIRNNLGKMDQRVKGLIKGLINYEMVETASKCLGENFSPRTRRGRRPLKIQLFALGGYIDPEFPNEFQINGAPIQISSFENSARDVMETLAAQLPQKRRGIWR